MNGIFFFTSLISFIAVFAFADNPDKYLNIRLFVDAYHYGLSGKDCSEIHLDSDALSALETNDPTTLKTLDEGCNAGRRDWIKGQRELPDVNREIINKQ